MYSIHELQRTLEEEEKEKQQQQQPNLESGTGFRMDDEEMHNTTDISSNIGPIDTSTPESSEKKDKEKELLIDDISMTDTS